MTSRLGAFGVTAVLGATGVSALMPMMCGPVSAPTVQEQVVTLTNQQRAAAGLAPLSVDVSLANAAQAHANDQATYDTMSHSGSDGSNAGTRIQRTGYPLQNWGENVAVDFATAQQVVAAWMASPGHRANILSGNFTQIGIGIAFSADGSPYWAMELASPW
ncbi:MAG: CAP domain-containing protein [Jiangellaceae bacterium]